MLEMVHHGKGALAGGALKSHPSSPLRQKPAPNGGTTKRKSRSPSPVAVETPGAAKTVSTEALQREHLKRLKKERLEDKAHLENGHGGGTVREQRVATRTGERASARKSINPRKVSVNKVELRVKEEKKEDEADRPAATAEEKFTMLLNGMATSTPKVPAAASSAASIKCDFQLEISDEDEEEKEGLKKVMESIEKDLSTEAEPSSPEELPCKEKSDPGDAVVVSEKKAVSEEVEKSATEATPSAEKDDEVEEKDEEEKKEDAESCSLVLQLEDSEEDGDVVAVKGDATPMEPGDAEPETRESEGHKLSETIDLDSSAEEGSPAKDEDEEEEEGTPIEGKESEEKDEKKGTTVEVKESKEKEEEKEEKKETTVEVKESDENEEKEVTSGKDGEEKPEGVVAMEEEEEEKKEEEVKVDDDAVMVVADTEKKDKVEGAAKPETEEAKVEAAEDVIEAKAAVEDAVAKAEDGERDSEATVALKRKREAEKDEEGNVEAEEQDGDDKKVKLEDGNDIAILTSEETTPVENGSLLKAALAANKNFAKKDKDKVYKLTQQEFEMLVISRVTEFFNDSNKSEIGALRQRCEQLEKCLEMWRQKAQGYLKKMNELHTLVQRTKRFATPQRPAMRSVGLQVQLTRYIPADPSKLVSRVAQMGVQGNRQGIMPALAPQGQVQSQHMIVPKQVSANQLAFVTNMGVQGTNKTIGMPQVSNLGATATVSTMMTSRPQPSSFSIPTRPSGNTQAPGSQLGVSLLQPRVGGLPGLILGSPFAASSGTNVVRAPAPSQVVRTSIDSKAVTSGATPIPTCLVQNQAMTNGQVTTAVPTQSSAGRNVSVSLIGQPPVMTGATAVKLIDLTADEEDAKALQAASAIVSNTTALPTMTVIPATLSPGTNTLTVLAPSSASGVSTGQILALSSAIVSNAGTLTTGTPIRMAAPIRGAGNAIMNQGSVRLTYLMPTSSMMTMVRPNQPVFMTPTTGIRTGQPGMVRQQGLQTIVLQRGTTLVPLQQGQMTTLPNVRPGTIVSPAKAVTTPVSVPMTIIGAPVTTRATTTLAPAGASSGAGANTLTRTSTVATAQVNVPVAKTVTAPPHFVKHPAPLPPQPKYPDNMAANKKTIPPKPALKISKVANGIVLSWNMFLSASNADVTSYQLYAYQEGTTPPSTSLWKKVGDVKALPLPMACTLTQFMEGHKYYFAVRAVDAFNRLGPFSDPGSIALVATNAVKPATTAGK